MSGTTRAVTVRRRFPAARERVFAAFQHRDALAQWFSPGPQVQVHILAFEFEPAGAFRFRYRFPDGSESTVKGAYRSIEPAQQLAFSWEWEEPDRHAGIETEVEISFVACGDDTEVIVRHDRLPDAASRDRYTSGWTTYLDRLAAYVGADDSR